MSCVFGAVTTARIQALIQPEGTYRREGLPAGKILSFCVIRKLLQRWPEYHIAPGFGDKRLLASGADTVG